MSNAKPLLQVIAFSDYICPFCYIGSRRLLQLRADYELQLNWCGLEIHPETPEQGMPVSQLGYSPDHWQMLMESLNSLATEENINLCHREFTTNSHNALLLAESAKQAGKEIFYDIHESIFSSFFCRGENIADRAVLLHMANQVGLKQSIAEDAWLSSEWEQRLQQQHAFALSHSITAVPCYVFKNQIIQGAQPLSVLKQAAVQSVSH